MILYAMESAWNSPSRTRGTQRMAVQPALSQTEDGGYSELETGGDQASEGGGAQTAQDEGAPKSGERRKTDEGGEVRRKTDSGDNDRIVRGRLRRR